jgi:membrane protein
MQIRSQIAALANALYQLYKDSGFAIAGSVAFGFIVSFFPFCIFVAALAGHFGGEALAARAIAEMFRVFPAQVAQSLAPEVNAVIGQSRIDLLTVGGLLSLFFATSAMEYLRAALNTAYRAREDRFYGWCLLQSALFVVGSAVATLVLTWGVVSGPDMWAMVKPQSLQWMTQNDWIAWLTRHLIVVLVLGSLLTAYHLWLSAGIRRFADVWPGVLLSVVLLIALAKAFSYYLQLTNYSRFYAGMTQIMIALVFFQVAAVLIMLGAEFNRGISELKVRRAVRETGDAMAPGAHNV